MTTSTGTVADHLAPAYINAMPSLIIDMVHENGALHPLKPVSLAHGTRVCPFASNPDAPAITKTAGVCGGRACIAGTWITVWGLVSCRNLGLDERAILAAVPLLTSDQLAAAFRYADENADEIAHDLAADITALRAAEADLTAAEKAAHGNGGQAGATKKEKHAAATRMVETVARIAGVGALSFAQNAAVRAQFEALTPKK